MDKYLLEREVKKDIERELTMNSLKMNPVVQMFVNRHIRNYINSLEDASFYNPAYVEDMKLRSKQFARGLMRYAEYGAITRRSFIMARASYCKTYPCRDGNN